MVIKDLKALYLDQIADLYSACKQAMPVVTELGRHATSPDLADALIAGNQGIARGMEILADLSERHDADPTDMMCKGMEGLALEAKRHALDTDFDDPDARDAAIISQYQRMAHYAIAGYGCLRSFAARLDLPDDAEALQDCLDNTRSGDLRMTAIAEGGVNQAALDGK